MFINSDPMDLTEISHYDKTCKKLQVFKPNEQNEAYPQSPQLPPKTPTRTPVMGTKTIHRRSFSNTSSQSLKYNVNNNSIRDNPDSTFVTEEQFQNPDIYGAINRDSFNSVPYSCNFSDTTFHQIPNRMRFYENINNCEKHHQSSSSSLPSSHCHTPVKSINKKKQEIQNYKSPGSISNAERRKRFFTPSSAELSIAENIIIPTSSKNTSSAVTSFGNEDQIILTRATINTVNNSKVSYSTTHSTPQDSFSDDSSYLSALSSRVRISPDNFLNDYIFTNRMSATDMQKDIVKPNKDIDDD